MQADSRDIGPQLRGDLVDRLGVTIADRRARQILSERVRRDLEEEINGPSRIEPAEPEYAVDVRVAPQRLGHHLADERGQGEPGARPGAERGEVGQCRLRVELERKVDTWITGPAPGPDRHL